jgi:hypothetical protein
MGKSPADLAAAAGIRKGFYDPYSNYGHYSRLECDGISEWHPSLLTLAPTLKGCLRDWLRPVEATEARANEYHKGNSNYPLLLIYASTKPLITGIKLL